MSWTPKIGDEFRPFQRGYDDLEARNSPVKCIEIDNKNKIVIAADKDGITTWEFPIKDWYFRKA